jgi:hypothetical protein
MLVAIGLFLLSPVTLLARAAGQLLLRVTGLRWWKLALASLAAIAAVLAVEGGPGPALAHHFSGYVSWLRQIGAAHLDYPAPGAFLWPQLPLAIPVGLLAAALNLAGRHQAIDPAEVRKQQREAQRRMDTAVRRAATVRDDHFGPIALGVQIDGDLGWADKRGLIAVPRPMQGRSRLIVGTSGTGKTTDIEREAFRAARDGRKFFLIDGKGTDPGFVERALAGYLWGNPHARVALWPELPMDGWRGNPAAIHNRLMAMLGWTEPYYQDVASLLLRLALNAPGEDSPVRSSGQLMARMDPELLVRLYEHDPDRRREAESLVGRDQARAVKGAIGRFANFFASVAGGFDAGAAGWSFEDVDFAYLRAPYLAAARTPTRVCGCCWRTSPTTPPCASPGEARTPPWCSTSSRPSPGAAKPPSSSWSGSGTPAAPCTCRRSRRTGWGMRLSSAAWSGPARVACSSMPCPTPRPSCGRLGWSRWSSRPGGWTARGRPEQLRPDRGAAPHRGHGGAAGPRGGGLVHRPGPLRAPDGRPHADQRRLPGTSPRPGRSGPVLATH